MNLIRFTFANIFDFKQVMDEVQLNELSPIVCCYHTSNYDKLNISFIYFENTSPYIEFVNSICTPTNIEELHE